MEDFYLFRLRRNRLVSVNLPPALSGAPPPSDWNDPVWAGGKEGSELIWIDYNSSDLLSMKLSLPATGALDLPTKIVRFSRAKTLLQPELNDDVRFWSSTEGSDGKRYLLALDYCEEKECTVDHTLRVSTVGPSVSVEENTATLSGVIVTKINLPGKSY